MLRFAANLSFLFPTYPFPDRFDAAAKAGFKGCEYLFPYGHEPDDIVRWLSRSGLKQVLFNLPPGDWDNGERGLAALPGREADFATSVEQALRYAGPVGCRRLHVMAGCADAESTASRDTYLSNLAFAAKRFADEGITALIEPINPIDMPGYFLTGLKQAVEVIEAVGAPNLKLQFDCYHRARMEANVVEELAETASIIGHIQIADTPGRHEPGTGTVNYDPIFRQLLDMGYSGWIGCEYKPHGQTEAGLGWRRGWE